MPDTSVPNENHAKAVSLSSLEYNENYYHEHVAAGLDYLGHGYWQESYGQMVSECTLQSTYDEPFMIDAGCACGSILTGFKKTSIYDRVMGVDLSDHMTTIGRKHFDLSSEEIKSGSIANIPLPDKSVTLVHSAQVLEHIPESITEKIISEFFRVLKVGGRAFLCLDAIRYGETKEIYMGDPTHVNVKPVAYWTEILQKSGLYFDIESYNAFVRSERGPTAGELSSFYQMYPYWSVWSLIKLHE